jgi:hypothetical protein
VLARDGMREESTCTYLVPILDWQGKTQLIKAAGVKYVRYCGKTRVPELAKVVFPEVPREEVLEKCHKKGLVDMMIGADNVHGYPNMCMTVGNRKTICLCGRQSSQHSSWLGRRERRVMQFRLQKQKKQHDRGSIRGVYRL